MEALRSRIQNLLVLTMLAFSWSALLSGCAVGGGDDPLDPRPLSPGQWTWVSGSDTINQAGVYGTLGMPAPENVPGARCGAVSWLDPNGNLWLFGGNGVAFAGYPDVASGGELNDLWKFDALTLEWSWVSGAAAFGQRGIYGTKGIAAPSNVPGARSGAVSWVDSSGKLWLFGGRAFGTLFDLMATRADFNDLWMFDPATVEWTWISGSNSADQPGVYGTPGSPSASNVPGARSSAVSWFDSSGKFWLFGGYGYDSAGVLGDLNDLWRFDPATLEWTWISGSSSIGQWGIYGTKGIPAPSNVPGGRGGAISWLDSHDNLYLFGGEGLGSGLPGYLNDVWKFDPATLEWTWISGSSVTNQRSILGTRGLPAPMNMPAARTLAVSWIDSSGKLWLSGGHGYDTAVMTNERFNDLWMYDLDAGEWTWVSGSDISNQNGIYGTKGTPSEDAFPGAREGGVSWFDSSGRLWLFGGFGDTGTYPSSGWIYLNDLWQYTR